MKILCIGDSNTYGYDPRSYIGSRYPEDVRWTGRLAGHEVINRGVNGMKVPRGHQRYTGLVNAERPDLVVIMLGTNDLLSGVSAEEITARMEAFLDEVMSAGRRVMLISPPLLQYGEWVMDGEAVEESESLGGMYRGLAERKGCMFADAGTWDIEMTGDGVHFSPEGHEAFARELLSCL